jgi:hypothetical protein
MKQGRTLPPLRWWLERIASRLIKRKKERVAS